MSYSNHGRQDYLSEIWNKEDCCGCAAYCSICPVKAIVMQIDEVGFEYSNIDEKSVVSIQQ